MITNVNKSNSIASMVFNKNVAIVAKEKTNATTGTTETTFVEFANLKDRNTQAVLKCIIAGILSDESITNELKQAFAVLENENGKKATFETENTAFAKAFVASRNEAKKALFMPPTFRRLIANFAENYKIGYSDNEGKFHTVLTVNEKCNLRALLLVDTRKINEFAAANSETRRAIVHTLAKAANKASSRETEYYSRYNATTTAKAPEAKPEATKGKGKKQGKPEAKPEEVAA